MKKQFFRFVICFILSCLAVICNAAQYSITSVSALNDCPINHSVGISSNGQVLVWDSDTMSYAYWNPSAGLNAIPITDDEVVLKGINGLGNAVGWRNNDTAIVVNQYGEIRDLAGNWANDVNDAGMVVGGAVYDAVLWQVDGTPITLANGTVNSRNVAQAISDNGLVLYTQDDIEAGIWQNRKSFIWKPGGITQQLEQPSGTQGVSIGGRAINNVGQVVGTLGGQAILWNPDGSIAADLGFGEAFDINNHGQIVGTLNGQAVLWDTNLNPTYLPLLEGWTGTNWSMSINDNGQIAGTVSYVAPGSYCSTAVLWEPVPEPSAFAALACGLVGIGIRRRFFG